MHHAIFFTLFLTVITQPLLSETRDPDMADNPKFAHAMQVETRTINQFPVVFHYGQVRPDFSDTSENPHRTRVSLDGDWKFRFDPKSTGITSKWFASELKLDNWKNVQVPHCWDAMPGGRYWDWSDRSMTNPPHYNGAAWYRKTFDHQPTDGKQQRISFLGVQQRVRVYLNGTEIALHEGGGAPFSVDITDYIKAGTNTLALKVIRLPNFKKKKDGKGWQEIDTVHTFHPKAPDCWPYAGILRSVSLIEEPSVSIRKSQIHTKNGKIFHAVIISNHSKKPTKLRVSTQYFNDALLPQMSDVIELQAGQTHVEKIITPHGEQIKKWSPETPVLVQAEAVLHDVEGKAFDALRSRFGIREFKTEGPRFKLNGKTIFLKGSSIYEEHYTRGGALTKPDHEKLFDLVKDSRSNFIRMHVIQRDPYAYQLADEKGILICGEWGGFWYKEKSMNTQTKDPFSIYQTMGRCAVWDLMNHPSVVLWGLHNESHQFGKEHEAFVKMGRELVLALDVFEKRPITWAAWHPHKGNPNFEYADAVGFNEYRGAMDPFERLDPDLKKVTRLNPNKPFIILENGAWSKRGSRGSIHKKNNENWQADLLKRQWKVLTKYNPHFSGYTYWLLSDYRSRKTYTGNKNQNGYSRMGIYDEHHLPKLLVREAFQNLSDPLK